MNSDRARTSITIVVNEGERKKIVRPGVARETYRDLTRTVDLVFVIDTTGSMSDKIEGLLATCAKFIDEFSEMNLDGRVAVVAFGDLTVPGDSIEHYGFADNIHSVKQYLKRIPRNGGGGNEGESSLEALQYAMGLQFRSASVKTLILITDEPALQHRIRASDMVERLRSEEFLTFVISPSLRYFREMAKSTGGKWYRISAHTDFTDLLEMFRQVAQKVSEVVSNVYELGDGSVTKYLQLKAPEE